MDFSIFRDKAGPPRFATTQAQTVGTEFSSTSLSGTWLKALRFYRASTGIFGTIRGRVYNLGTGEAVPGSDVSITLANGSGQTGWITLPLSGTYPKLTNNLFVVAFNFPGGTGNGIPRSKDVPTSVSSNLTDDYWRNGPGGQGWKNGPLQMERQSYAYEDKQCRVFVGSTLTLPTNASPYDHGLDVVVTDTDPNPTQPSGPVATIFGPTPPNVQVNAVAGPAVVGLEFTPQVDVWATSLRLYRPQGSAKQLTPIINESMYPYPLGSSSGPGIVMNQATGALYKVVDANTGEQVEASQVVFRPDTAVIPALGYAYSAGITGWQEGFMPQPVKLEAGQRYRIVAGLPDGRPSAPSFFASGGPGAQGLSVGPLVVSSPANAVGGAAASLITGSSTLAFPTASTTANPYLDVTVTTENPNDPREPENPVRIFSGTQMPDTFNVGIGSRTNGIEFTPTAPSTAYGLRYYCYNGIAATAGRLYTVSLDKDVADNPTGFQVAGSEVTFPANPTSGWQFAPFRTPLRLTVGQRYKIAVRFPSGYITSNFFFAEGQSQVGSDGLTNSLAKIPNNTQAAGGKQGTYVLVDGFPVETFNGGNPWVDITLGPGGDTSAGAAGTSSEPSGAYRMFGVAAPNPLPLVSKNHTRSVGFEFQVERQASAWGARFYRPDTTLTGPVQSRLYAIGDGDYATEVIGADTVFTVDTSTTGWLYAPYRAPIVLRPGRRYKLVVFFGNGYPTTPGYYAQGGDGEFNDRVDGPLRGFSSANATRSQQPTAVVGGVQSDLVTYPTGPAADNPWIDITVTDGAAPAAVTTAEEPVGASRAFSVADPAPGNITLLGGPANVGHQILLSSASTCYGLRVWRPDLRGQTAVGRIYRVDTGTTVSGTVVTFPAPTAKGWAYAPFANGITLEAGVQYRVVVNHPTLVPYTVNALTSPIVNGVVTTQSAWTADGATVVLPTQSSQHSFWVDATLTVGATNAPANTLTLFSSTPDATVSVRTDGGPSTRGTTFGGDAGPDGNFYVTAIRFWRPTTGVSGTITGRIYEVARNGSVPIPYTDVVFRLSGTGWQTAELPYPVPLSPIPWYRVAVHFPTGHPYTPAYFTTGPGAQQRYGPNGTVVLPPYNYSGGDGVQGGYVQGDSLGYPSRGIANSQGTPWGENYWVDIVATTATPDVVPPPAPRIPLSYSQFGQISNTSVQVGTTFQFAQVANNVVPGSRSIGLEFTVDTAAWFVAYRFPRLIPSQQARTVTARLFTVTGPTSGAPVAGSDATFSFNASFWQAAHLDTPVPLTAGQRYKAVFQFPDGTPVGVGTRPLTDKLRGPLRVFSDANATASTSVTSAPTFSLSYPVDAWQPLNTIDGTPVVDIYVSTDNPAAVVPGVRSVFGRRKPPSLTVQAWGNRPEVDGTFIGGVNNAMEFYVATSSCFLRAYRYYRLPYPTVTQLTQFRLYRVTGTAAGTYFPDIDCDYDTTTGELVTGSLVTMPQWVTDPNQPDAYAEGWVTVPLTTPIALTQGQRYRVAAWYPNVPGNTEPNSTSGEGARPVTHFYWGTGPGRSGHVDGPLIAPSQADATKNQQGSFETRYDDARYPSATKRGNAAQYWMDVEVLDTAPRNVDGGTVTVTLPPIATDPRKGGLSARSYVSGRLAVEARATATRHVATDPTAPTLDVQAKAWGGRGLGKVLVDVRSSSSGSKAVEAAVEHLMATQPRQAARRPKGVSDLVHVDINPVAEARSSIPWTAMPREPDILTFNPEAVEYRFLAQNIMTRQFMHMDLPIVNPTLTWNLSGPFQLTGSLTPAYLDILDLGLDEWGTFIHVELQGRIVASGILMPWSVRGEELTIDVVGVSTYAHGIPYLDIYEKFFPDVMEVIRELWRHIQSFPNGNLGLQFPAGYLGVPLFGDPVYDSYTGEFLGWKKWSLLWTNFQDCGALFDSLAASTPFDYLEVQQWNSTRTDVLHGIKVGYPRLGKRLNALRFAEGENVLEAIPISEPDDSYASDVILKGAGEGYTQIFAWVGDVFWDRLRRVAIITDEQVQSEEVGFGIAIAELIRRIYARGIDQVVVEAFHPFAPFGQYQVGDDILIEGMIPYIGEFALWHRITAISMQPESGLVTLQVARSESFRYGRPDPTLGLL